MLIPKEEFWQMKEKNQRLEKENRELSEKVAILTVKRADAESALLLYKTLYSLGNEVE